MQGPHSGDGGSVEVRQHAGDDGSLGVMVEGGECRARTAVTVAR